MYGRFDDDEMNITPEIARALGYRPSGQAQPRRIPHADHVAADSPWWPILMTIMALVCLVWLGAAVTAHQRAAAQSQPQIPQESVRVAAEPPPDVSVATAQSPAQQEIATPAPVVEPTTEIQEREGGQSPDVQASQGEVAQSPDVQATQGEVAESSDVQATQGEVAQSSDVQANQGNEIPQHWPAAYGIGRVTTPTFASPRDAARLPRRSPWIYTGTNPSSLTSVQTRTAGTEWHRSMAGTPVMRRFIPVCPTSCGPYNRDFRRRFVMIRRIP